MGGCGQVNNLVLMALSQFEVLISRACGVPDLMVQQNSLASWKAGERAREHCYLGSQSSFALLGVQALQHFHSEVSCCSLVLKDTAAST